MATVSIGRRCCFPIISFLHVPGKMSQPTWLMMGTAFLVQCWRPTTPLDGSQRQQRLLLLTAKHTFVPWQYVSDPQRLKIPEEFRKTRFVVGRLYLPDNEGRAMASRVVDLRLLALHPVLDVALLALKPPRAAAAAAATTATTAAAATSSGGEPDVCAEVEREAAAAGGGLKISAANPEKGDLCVIHGYRGAGSLGLLDTLDPDLLDRLSTEQRDELLSLLKNVEGQQLASTINMEVLDASGLCRATEGCCHHGMSGAPVLMGDETCGGILYGNQTGKSECFSYTPASSFRDWLRSAAAAAAAAE